MGYQKEQINELADNYGITKDEATFNELLECLKDIIRIQLAQNYGNFREDWDDLEQEVIIRLWKRRNNLESAKNYINKSQYYWGIIRGYLNDCFRQSKGEPAGITGLRKTPFPDPEDEKKDVKRRKDTLAGDVNVMTFEEIIWDEKEEQYVKKEMASDLKYTKYGKANDFRRDGFVEFSNEEKQQMGIEILEEKEEENENFD